jgi:hypothetical protein
VYVFDGFSDLCILISHVWSPFHGCGASVWSSSLEVDLTSLKHQSHIQTWFGIVSSIQILWIGLLRWLSRSCYCTCNPWFQGQISCNRKIVHMPSQVSDTFLWP